MSANISAAARSPRDRLAPPRETPPDRHEDIFDYYEARLAVLLRGCPARGGRSRPPARTRPATQTA